MNEVNAAKMTKTGAIVTPRGRLSFFGKPALFQPQLMKGEIDQKKAAFQAMLLFPKDADISLLRSTVKERVKAKAWTSAEKEKVLKADGMFHKAEDDTYLAEFAEDLSAPNRLVHRRSGHPI